MSAASNSEHLQQLSALRMSLAEEQESQLQAELNERRELIQSDLLCCVEKYIVEAEKSGASTAIIQARSFFDAMKCLFNEMFAESIENSLLQPLEKRIDGFPYVSISSTVSGASLADGSDSFGGNLSRIKHYAPQAIRVVKTAARKAGQNAKICIDEDTMKILQKKARDQAIDIVEEKIKDVVEKYQKSDEELHDEQ